MTTIDHLDEQILAQLLDDGRKSLVDIGKTCNTPYEEVLRHYRKMVKEGIIVGATTEVNFRALGFQYMATIMLDVKEENATAVKEFLTKQPNIAAVYSSNKKFNVSAIFRLHHVQELDQIKEEIRRQGLTTEVQSSLWLDIRNIASNLFRDALCKSENSETTAIAEGYEKSTDIDQIDRYLIDRLTEDGRCSFNKIASEIGTSVDRIIRRYEKLKKNNVIKTVIQINPQKLGYRAYGFFFLSVQQTGHVDDAIDQLSMLKNVFHLIKIIGASDFYISCYLRDFDEFFAIKTEISKIPYLKLVKVDINDVGNVFPGKGLHISTF
jgi:Lrp/AsnC family transcriptional regulator, regulator for asnA, asnC and gidA